MKNANLLLEPDLQTELDIPGAPGTDDRVPGIDVGSSAGPAETRGRPGVILSSTSAGRCAVRIGADGVIEQIEKLGPELDAIALLEREVLENREIHVLEARVPEDVPAHRAKGSFGGRSHDRVAGNEAATCRERCGVGGL